METPASISGDDQAAMAIQQAYRKFQKRIVKDHEDLATVSTQLPYVFNVSRNLVGGNTSGLFEFRAYLK